MNKLVKIALSLFIALLLGVFLQKGRKKGEEEPTSRPVTEKSDFEAETIQASPSITASSPSVSPTPTPTPTFTFTPVPQTYEHKPDLPKKTNNPVPYGNVPTIPRTGYHSYAPPPPPPWPYANREGQLRRKNRRGEVEEIMKSLRPRNLAPYSYVAPLYFPSSTPSGGQFIPIQEPNAVDHLLGKFEGEIKFDKDSKVWQMLLELKGKTEDQKFIGSTYVELLENGKSINKITQSGELNITKKLAENSLAIVFTPFENHHFQLYYLQDQDVFAGNYYAKTAPNNFEPKGTLRLLRKTP